MKVLRVSSFRHCLLYIPWRCLTTINIQSGVASSLLMSLRSYFIITHIAKEDLLSKFFFAWVKVFFASMHEQNCHLLYLYSIPCQSIADPDIPVDRYVTVLTRIPKPISAVFFLLFKIQSFDWKPVVILFFCRL